MDNNQEPPAIDAEVTSELEPTEIDETKILDNDSPQPWVDPELTVEPTAMMPDETEEQNPEVEASGDNAPTPWVDPDLETKLYPDDENSTENIPASEPQPWVDSELEIQEAPQGNGYPEPDMQPTLLLDAHDDSPENLEETVQWQDGELHRGQTPREFFNQIESMMDYARQTGYFNEN